MLAKICEERTSSQRLDVLFLYHLVILRLRSTLFYDAVEHQVAYLIKQQ
jgi:hypothetical protein